MSCLWITILSHRLVDWQIQIRPKDNHAVYGNRSMEPTIFINGSPIRPQADANWSREKCDREVESYPTSLCSICKNFGTRNPFVHVICINPWNQNQNFAKMVDVIVFSSWMCHIIARRTKNLSCPPFLQNQKIRLEGSMKITCINGFLVPKFLQILYREVR